MRTTCVYLYMPISIHIPLARMCMYAPNVNIYTPPVSIYTYPYASIHTRMHLYSTDTHVHACMHTCMTTCALAEQTKQPGRGLTRNACRSHVTAGRVGRRKYYRRKCVPLHAAAGEKYVFDIYLYTCVCVCVCVCVVCVCVCVCVFVCVCVWVLAGWRGGGNNARSACSNIPLPASATVVFVHFPRSRRFSGACRGYQALEPVPAARPGGRRRGGGGGRGGGGPGGVGPWG
jgi:hypothetical protein